MPTYEYACDECGKRFEQFQSISDPPLQKCPYCGAAVRRLIGSGAGVIMKGAPRRHCSQTRPCCGREERCDKPPCQ